MSGTPCPFCTPKCFYEDDLVRCIWDNFPVSPGHALIVPRRHVPTWFDASEQEQQAIVRALPIVRNAILSKHQPDGFNVGINIGAAGGQTVFHLHVHVIPRYSGDVPDPRGGVRHVIPAKANYLDSPKPSEFSMLRDAPHVKSLIQGLDDPLLPHLLVGIDQASSVDISVAFVMESGLRLIIEHLKDLLARNGRLRFLTGDYLGITDPNALAQLLDLVGNAEVRIFETAGRGSFHPKSYILQSTKGLGTAFVGSSNLSGEALGNGVEWNYRVITSTAHEGYAEICRAFERLFRHPATRKIDDEWISGYRARRPTTRILVSDAPRELGLPPPSPHRIQLEAMQKLRETRVKGNSAGLVVLATGLGKTWLSAFDSHDPEFRRILFVAHREEILAQALETFRRIRPEAVLGYYTGTEKQTQADILFASIQTLGKARHFQQFKRNHFDYIVVDEFHHASARTYRQLIDYFTPRFMLGLTATPERSDGGDLLALCQENLVYRCDLVDGIKEDLLCPFHYFGVPDEVDYQNIPWRSTRFDEEALTTAVATRVRAMNILDQFNKRAGKRTLAFCCSQRHADFMSRFFNDNGISSVAVHAGGNSAPRAASLERLGAGELQVVCAVDMFNEGVDLPNVDTIMMLRPTESSILWLQQFGRGLRTAPGKDRLTVIDYIGNHRMFLLKPRTLLGLNPGDSALERALNAVAEGSWDLPPGCEVTYELEAVNILKSLMRRPKGIDVMVAIYQGFREDYGRRPTATEMLHSGAPPRHFRIPYGSWFEFVKAMKDLTPDQEKALVLASEFLSIVETTEMTKSYKMVVLKAMINRDALPGSISVGDLVGEVGMVVRRSAVLRADFGGTEDKPDELRRLLERNPLHAWCEGKGTGDKMFFRRNAESFETMWTVSDTSREAYQEMIGELVDFRLAEYQLRDDVEPSISETTQAVDRSRLWQSYLRKDIAPLFGLIFNSGNWNSGFVTGRSNAFLLVTLDKKQHAQNHQYSDRFLSTTVFQWESQNITRQNSKRGRLIRDHASEGIAIQLFVRRDKQSPFFYCGAVEFIDWEGEEPITVRWRLSEPVPEHLRTLFRVPAG